MSSGYFPTDASYMHSYTCPTVEGVGIIPHTGTLPSRGCKRGYESLQERSPVSLAAAAPSANLFHGAPYGKGCTVDRSASMDSDISSFSPVPKRHCFCPSEAPTNPGLAQCDYHIAQQQQQQQDFCLQQHASIPAATFADAQKAYALKLMLSQRSPKEAAALVAFLQRSQRLKHAAASQPSQAQPQWPTLQSTVSQPVAQYSSNRLPPSTILKLQAAYGQIVKASQHQQQQQHTGDTLPQHIAAESRQISIDAFMSQLREIQTPAQYGEDSSSMVAGSAAAAWYDNSAVPAEPSTAAYQPVQPQIDAHWSAYHQEHRTSQPDCAWQLAAAASRTQVASTGLGADTSHSPAALARCLLYKHGQLKMALLQHQRLQEQQLMASAARKQQAFLERQAALSPIRPVSSPIRPALDFPELLAYWAKGLSLQRCESVYLACHLWTKVQQQVSIAYMHLLGAERPWETMLLGCLWLAAKLEECRRGVPTASKTGALVGVDKSVMGGVELYLMQLVNWAPLAGWKDRPLQVEDDSWF